MAKKYLDEKILTWLDNTFRELGLLRELEMSPNYRKAGIVVVVLCTAFVLWLTVDENIEFRTEAKIDLEEYVEWMETEMAIGRRIMKLEEMATPKGSYLRGTKRMLQEGEWRLKQDLLRAPLPRTLAVQNLHLSLSNFNNFSEESGSGWRWGILVSKTRPWAGREPRPDFSNDMIRDYHDDIALLKQNAGTFYRSTYLPMVKSMCDDLGVKLDESKWKVSR